MSELINLDDLVNSLNKQEEQKRHESDKPIADENFLSFVAGNTYLLRLLPNMANPASETFVDYEEYGFTSLTGAYIYAGRTPNSVGRKDIVKDLQWKTYSEGLKNHDEELKKRSYTLFPQKKQMVNVYVIDDPVNPENNGSVKILRYSSKRNKLGEPISPIFAKIYDAVHGDNSKDIGKRAFDLTANGVSLAIKVKKNSGGWNDYSESSFKFPSDLGLSVDEIKGIYGQTKDLSTFIPEVKSDEDLNTILAIHWYGTEVASTTEESLDLSSGLDEDDEIPMGVTGVSTDINDEMTSFLDGLESLSD